MNYQTLEKEIKIKTEKLMEKSWRGDLSRKGIDKIEWNDLQYIQSEVTNIKNKKENK